MESGDAYTGIIDCFKKIIKNDGFHTLWRGNFTNICRTFPLLSFSMSFKDKLKKKLCPYDPQQNRWKFALGNIWAGGIAGGLALTLVYPLDFSRTRLCTDLGKSPKDR